MKHILSYKLFEGKDDKKPQETSEKDMKKRWKKKRSAILTLGNNIKKLRTKVSKDMDSEDEKTMIIATIIRIMDLTGERVGNDSSAGEGRHGVTNFRKKHAKIDGDTVTLSYSGKSDVKHKVTIKDSKVARNMNKLMKIPEFSVQAVKYYLIINISVPVNKNIAQSFHLA